MENPGEREVMDRLANTGQGSLRRSWCDDWAELATEHRMCGRRHLSVGLLLVMVIAVTGCGGGGSSRSTQTQNDRVAPTVAITGPTSAGTYTSLADNIIISGNAADNVGVSRVTWSLNGAAPSDVVGLNNWTTPVIALNQGGNTITVSAVDDAGNRSNAQIVVTFSPGPANVLSGIGILGDSNSDEYRADDNRGAEYASVTFNWVEQLVLRRGLNFGTWGMRASPRRSGFEYNWALSGATTASMLSSGQHTGLAQQIADGKITLVYVYIGHNDFAREKYAEIYDGTVSGQALDAKIADVVGNITEAVDTVLAAGPVSVIVVDLYDYSVERPRLLAAFPDPVRRQAVTDAIRQVNADLAMMAQQRGIVKLSLTAHVAAVLGSADANGFIHVGGELIDTNNFGNEPHFLNLDDGSHHGGTIANGLFANEMFIKPVDNSFQAGLPLLTDQELLESAGIAH